MVQVIELVMLMQPYFQRYVQMHATHSSISLRLAKKSTSILLQTLSPIPNHPFPKP